MFKPAKIVLIENDLAKRDDVTWFLKGRNIEFEIFEFVNPALRYIMKNSDNIHGIILDLGLQSVPGMRDYSPTRGMDVVNELKRKGLEIPVLINSTTKVDGGFDQYPFVYGQRDIVLGDYRMLEDFINSLT